MILKDVLYTFPYRNIGSCGIMSLQNKCLLKKIRHSRLKYVLLMMFEKSQNN
jgi:hypothetical protein